ncbi:exported hypothetical protein [Burkholderia gladioli]|nr:exported hypothetical protein [Burkholderia gladioli]
MPPVSRRAVRAVMAMMLHPLPALPVAMAVPVTVTMPAHHHRRAADLDVDDLCVGGAARQGDTEGGQQRGDQGAFHGLLLERWIGDVRRVSMAGRPAGALARCRGGHGMASVWRLGRLISVWICNLGFAGRGAAGPADAGRRSGPNFAASRRGRAPRPGASIWIGFGSAETAGYESRRVLQGRIHEIAVRLRYDGAALPAPAARRPGCLRGRRFSGSRIHPAPMISEPKGFPLSSIPGRQPLCQ